MYIRLDGGYDHLERTAGVKNVRLNGAKSECLRSLLYNVICSRLEFKCLLLGKRWSGLEYLNVWIRVKIFDSRDEIQPGVAAAFESPKSGIRLKNENVSSCTRRARSIVACDSRDRDEERPSYHLADVFLVLEVPN